ncbi:ribonuclease regulator [Vibrio azureus]|uniref:Uncharacterized protein n=1 Tax=Vibrio azureus NBRC 104587 TaxID=1219077 RepID=U3A895_9VIBR|nr:hypothetical protein [Vibrio azureus]AUI85313.1 ribonuclease regulator [Vibrio azureus]GAD76171.1 hypothetical protein VAZ01S_038_00500 [Vibrio azureus NBRC 104587]
MKKWALLILGMLPFAGTANVLPPLSPQSASASPHKLFISGDNQLNDNFDVWSIDSGYAYEVIDSVDLYIGARLNNSSTNNQSGLLSGVRYHFNERITLNSSLRTYSGETIENPKDENSLAAELSSRVKLSEHLDIHARLDYQQQQQGIEVGLGFRF